MNDISVVIPMFNGKKYIEKNVEELLKIQHLKEIIIVDDGSSDDSYNYCLKRWGNNSEIILLSQKNGGIVKARNTGLDAASGKYVIFVDQDDTVVSEVIDTTIDYIEKEECQIGFWSTNFRFENGQQSPCDKVYKDCVIRNSVDIKKLIVDMLLNKQTKYISYIGHVWACVFQLNLLKENCIRFKKFIDYEDDYLFVLETLSSVHSCAFISGVGYNWSVNLNSYSHVNKYTDDYLKKSEKLSRHLIEIANKSDISSEEIIDIQNYWLQSTIIKTIRNCGSRRKIDWSELRLIRNRMKKYYYRNAFQEKMLLENDTRFKAIYYLVKMKLYTFAVIMVNVYYNAHRLHLLWR